MAEHLAPQEERLDVTVQSQPSGLPEAALADLPKVLAAPPWTEKRKNTAPREIPGLQAPAPQLVSRGD